MGVGALGEAVEPARCDSSCRLFSSEIDALRSTASSARSDATAKEGHVNHDVSDVPVEARVNPTTGSGWYGWVLAARRRDVKLFFLLSLARAVMAALRTPPRAVEGRRVTCGVL